MEKAVKTDDVNKPEPAQEAKASGLSGALGRFAHQHKDFFTSRTGELLFRNAARTIVAVVPTAIAFMVSRKAFFKYDQFAAKNPESAIVKALPAGKGALSMWQRVGFIFGGFTVFRAFCRTWQRGYDRVFSAKDEAGAAQAISALPANAVKDSIQMLPAEMAGVAVGALPLAAVKAGFVNPATINVNKGDFAMAKKGFVNDWLASVPAYIGFFESADRIYDHASGSCDSPEYYRKLKGLPEAAGDQQKESTFMNRDGLGRIAFRRTGSLLLGVAAFMGGMRYSKAKFGNPDPQLKGVRNFINNTAKEYAAFVPFVGYTVLADLYNQGYDALFGKMQDKHAQTARH